MNKEVLNGSGIINMHPMPQVSVILPLSLSHKRLLWWFLAIIKAGIEDYGEFLILEKTNRKS